jgi:hypothetical protein
MSESNPHSDGHYDIVLKALGMLTAGESGDSLTGGLGNRA